jgi:hypothetical protein
MKIEGEVRGVVFQTDARYILEKEGEEGLKKLEERVRELGYPIDYRTAGALNFYPLGLRAISLLLIKDTFGWGDEEIREMGYAAPQTSFIVKLLMRFLADFKKFVGGLPENWTRHWTRGEMEVLKMDEKTKEVALRLKDIKIHPILCLYLEGYFRRIYEFVVGKGKGEVKETKCMFNGDPYHEYIATTKRE